jgi:hypothetical protein
MMRFLPCVLVLTKWHICSLVVPHLVYNPFGVCRRVMACICVKLAVIEHCGRQIGPAPVSKTSGSSVPCSLPASVDDLSGVQLVVYLFATLSPSHLELLETRIIHVRLQGS